MRMNAKYQELMDERKRLPRDATGNRLSAVIKPLTDCLDHAFEKLDEHRKSKKGLGGARTAPGANKGGWVVAGEDDDDEDEEEEEEDEEEREMRGGWSVVR